MEQELEQEPKPEYLKGFNEGYTIAKHMPDVAEKLSKALGESERAKGFQQGRDQLLSEKDKQRYPSWLNRDEASPERTDYDKDKEGYEPER
jgi:hypothetical protein